MTGTSTHWHSLALSSDFKVHLGARRLSAIVLLGRYLQLPKAVVLLPHFPSGLQRTTHPPLSNCAQQRLGYMLGPWRPWLGWVPYWDLGDPGWAGFHTGTLETLAGLGSVLGPWRPWLGWVLYWDLGDPGWAGFRTGTLETLAGLGSVLGPWRPWLGWVPYWDLGDPGWAGFHTGTLETLAGLGSVLGPWRPWLGWVPYWDLGDPGWAGFHAITKTPVHGNPSRSECQCTKEYTNAQL